MAETNIVARNLTDLINKELDRRINVALGRACLVVENEAKRNCPVETGQLRNSITHFVYNSRGTVGTNVEYAPYVHEGTGIYKADGRQEPWAYQDLKGEWHYSKGQKPNPFLKRALEENINKIKEQFEGIL